MNAAFQVRGFAAAVDGTDLELAASRLSEVRKQVEYDRGMREEDALAFIAAVSEALDCAAALTEEAAQESAIDSEDVSALRDLEADADGLAGALRALIMKVSKRAASSAEKAA